jgi:hypothetical protein
MVHATSATTGARIGLDTDCDETVTGLR